MSPKKQTHLISALVMIAFFILIIDILFSNKGFIFLLIISGILIYYGRRKYPRTSGKLYFWLGCLILFFAVISLLAIKLIILAIVGYFVWKYFNSKNHPEQQRILSSIQTPSREEVYIKKPWLIKNRFFGRIHTPDHAYEWEDIHIQSGVGDTVIDLGYTVLPKGESVISIRKLVGNITILVPYDLEVSIYHSVILGSADVFQREEPHIFNQNLLFQSSRFEEADERIKIITCLIVGDLEVKRV